MARKPGEKTPLEDLKKKPFKYLINETRKQVRSDHGGKDAIANIQKRIPTLTAKQAEQVQDLIVEKIAGRRKSIEDKLDEMERRIFGEK